MSSEPTSPEPPAREGALRPPARPGPAVDTGTEDLSGEGSLSLGDSAPANPASLLGESGRIAQYRVLKFLGQGGMGAVYQAEDTDLGRAVALKVILPEFAAKPAARERFLREARACAALKSDHVVTIYQVGQDRGVPFLAMEFLRGEALEDRLAREGALPWPEVVRIGRQVCDGLAAAHGQGLVHRDIKPSNVWLEAPAGRVKLIDFGLARVTGSQADVTRTGVVVGSPEFMSPEQAQGDELDPRTDLFSLGAVLYAMCTGRRPFQGVSVMAVLYAVGVRTPAPIRDLNPDVPPDLAALVGRLLEKDRENRPVSAADVRRALDAVGAGDPGSAAGWGPPAAGTVTGGPTAVTPSPARPAPRLRRPAFFAAATVGLIAALGALAWSAFGPRPADPHQAGPSGPPLRVGVLHSRTGTMAISERPVIDAALLAVEEVNAQGGVLGRLVEAVVADGQSDEAEFARQAERLVTEEKVCTVFGCWTSASRKAVVGVVERHDHLLVYPVQYEGVEQSPNVVYLGPVPNQQIVPALSWVVGFEGKRRWFLVGSDYVFPATANAVVRDEARARGCEVVGEEYLPLGGTDVAGVVRKVVGAKPDLIVNTINGDTNVAFYRALRRAGLDARATPTLSFSISEEELGSLGPRETAGEYLAGSYFQALDGPANREFLHRFGQRYGAGRVVSSPMQAAYAGVHLWAEAARAAGRDDPRSIRDAIKGRTYDAPQGPIRIDPATQHTVQTARVGRVDEAGRVVEVYQSPRPIEPTPFPATRSREQWLTFLDGLHERWGGRWSNPGP